jgi:pyruvate,orthophosphate dikinase
MLAPRQLVFDIAQIDPNDTGQFGGKAAGLARMASAGLPIPPAFVLSTDAYHAYRHSGERLPAELMNEVRAGIRRLEERTGTTFGGRTMPLLVSVRSGAKVSMPGMMDTVLNLGVHARSALALARAVGSAQFAVDTWLRFWKMFVEIVLRGDSDDLLEAVAEVRGRAESTPSMETFEALEGTVLSALKSQGIDASMDPHVQLEQAIKAVFESWDSKRAQSYREHHGISHELGTAVTVQAMVFGNLDAQSGSGVAFTRNPNTGANCLYGEYLVGRQGEDLVSGVTSPVDLVDPESMNATLRDQLVLHGQTLERIYRDAVDIEFTVEKSRLYLLQVRAAKRTAQAAVKIAVDMVDDGFLPPKEALKLVSAEQVKRLLRPAFDPNVLATAEELTAGVGSSPGHAFGMAVLDSDRAADLAATGEHVLLLRPTTSPQDIRGMLSGQGIVTAKGGALSHAAVVSRALDKPCVVGCEDISVDLEARRFTIRGRTYPEGTPLSIDGTTGKIYAGVLPLLEPGVDEGSLGKLLSWADEITQASFWITSHSASEARDAARQRPEGLGVVALTNLLVSAGTVDDLVATINDLSQGRQGPEVQDRLSRLAYEACRGLMLESPGAKIDIRLPNVSSPRAQRLIDTWTGLAPRLFLPLGMPLFCKSMVHGIAGAAKDMGHKGVTVLIGGITDPAEFKRFRDLVVEFDQLSVGAVIQNAAALLAAPSMLDQPCALWMDLREITRTFHGFPDGLSFADDVFDSYAAEGYVAVNPKTDLAPFLLQGLANVVASARDKQGVRLGIDCGSAVAPAIVEKLYSAGYRSFSVFANQYPVMRLMLAQLRP